MQKRTTILFLKEELNHEFAPFSSLFLPMQGKTATPSAKRRVLLWKGNVWPHKFSESHFICLTFSPQQSLVIDHHLFFTLLTYESYLKLTTPLLKVKQNHHRNQKQKYYNNHDMQSAMKYRVYLHDYPPKPLYLMQRNSVFAQFTKCAIKGAN